MKLKPALFGMVILAALFVSAVGSPATAQTLKAQDTVAPELTLVQPTVVVQITPGVPVTGQSNAPDGLWTLILFGLLGLLALAFLVALFSPRTVVHEHHDHPIDTPPHDHEV